MTSSFEGSASKPTASATAYAVALQPDGKIVAAGKSEIYVGPGFEPDFALARFNADGSLDSTFSGGQVTTEFGGSIAYDVALQPDGRIIAAGASNEGFALARYTSDGALDPTFSADGKVTTSVGSDGGVANAVAVQSDGKIVAAGYADRTIALARYNPDGSLDPTFSADGKVTTNLGVPDFQASDVVLQPDGRIVVAGGPTFQGIYLYGYESIFVLARYKPDGSLDSSFSQDGIVATSVSEYGEGARAVTLQPDGKIVAAGEAGSDGFAFVRYAPDGSLDPSFSGDGRATVELGSGAEGVALQPGGRIIAAGSGGGPRRSVGDFGVARLNSDGTPDASFSDDARVTTDFFTGADTAFDVAVQPDGRIVAAGEASGEFALARYMLNGGKPDADGDGIRDTRDRCPPRYGPEPAGCPRHPRSLTIEYDKEELRFHGELSSAYLACRHRNKVSIFKKRPGRDQEVGATTTRSGGYALRDPARSGRYYAKTGRIFSPEIGTCPGERSPTIDPRPNR